MTVSKFHRRQVLQGMGAAGLARNQTASSLLSCYSTRFYADGRKPIVRIIEKKSLIA